MKRFFAFLLVSLFAFSVNAGTLPEYFDYLGAGGALSESFMVCSFSPVLTFETDILAVRGTAYINTKDLSRFSIDVVHRPIRDSERDAFVEIGMNLSLAGRDDFSFTSVALYTGVSKVIEGNFSFFAGLYPISLTFGDAENTGVLDGGFIGVSYFIRK
jgi:hypothetical protein